MSFLDSASLNPQTTPWAPKVPLAPTPADPPAPAQKPVVAAMQSLAPDAKAARITPETHPHFFEAPQAASGNDFCATVRKRESGGNDLAWNGVAAGRYQFTPQTWLGVAAAHPDWGCARKTSGTARSRKRPCARLRPTTRAFWNPRA